MRARTENTAAVARVRDAGVADTARNAELRDRPRAVLARCARGGAVAGRAVVRARGVRAAARATRARRAGFGHGGRTRRGRLHAVRDAELLPLAVDTLVAAAAVAT